MIVLGLCPTGKKGYLDELDALIALTDLSVSRDGKVKTERDIYECSGCGFWHLTSQVRGMA